MYRDPVQWSRIRKQIRRKETSIRGVCRETGISCNTVKKMLLHPLPPMRKPRTFALPVLAPHVATIRRLISENDSLPPRSRLSIKTIYEHIKSKENFAGGYSTVKDFATKNRRVPDCIWTYAYNMIISLEKSRAIDFMFMLSRAEPLILSETKLSQLVCLAGLRIPPIKTPSPREVRETRDKEWLRSVLQNAIPLALLHQDLGEFEGRAELLRMAWNGRISIRNKALTVLASRKGIRAAVICTFLDINKTTFHKYRKAFDAGGIQALVARKITSTRKYDNEDIKKAVFALLHESPQAFGFNRTSWRMVDFTATLSSRGFTACPEVIRRITKKAGYKWRKARTVLTSSDPEYRTKLAAIQAVLSSLKSSEAFFSIDEFGPFAVKSKGGRTLTPPGVQKTIPQWQKSKGCLILTAALELSENQVTHFYSTKKNTSEMIKMMQLLIHIYSGKKTIYLSWDAASWHISKRLANEISAHNNTAGARGLPVVKTAPLPTGAQFLNVIESVFSGMARAIIHNSDYQSMEHAKAAIDRYFSDRNQQFQKSPRRAGKKIWGLERELSEFAASNNCKDPHYR